MHPRAPIAVLAIAAILQACGGTDKPVTAPTTGAVTAEGGSAKKSDIALGAAGPWEESHAPLPVSSNDPMWGKREAPVTLVIFSDFQCPFCSRLVPTMDRIKTTYGPNKVRIFWKNRPLSFHPGAKPAAEAGTAVFFAKGSDAFWSFHDAAFENQRELSGDADASIARWVSQQRVSPAELDRNHRKAEEKVKEDIELADKVGATGTPATYINGVKVSGAQPFDNFQKVIDIELAKALAKIAGGTPPSDLYTVASRENFAPEPEERDETIDENKTVWNVPVGASPTRGSADALVTIVEFGDFQCPFCVRAQPTVQEIDRNYPGKVRFVFKHLPLPFHPRALPAARVSMLAKAEKGDKGFWSVHDTLFGNGGKQLEDNDLVEAAKAIGIAPAKTNAAIASTRPVAAIDDDQALAKRLGVNGTPTFFINGRKLTGAQPFNAFKPLLDQEFAASEARVKSGTPAAKVYEAIIKDGQKGDTAQAIKPAPKGALPSADAIKNLTMTITTPGTGAVANPGQTVRVHYIGTLLDGSKFDSSRDRGTPFEFKLGGGQVIKGLDQGVLGMRVGETRTLVIPYDLAYGEAGRPPKIPAKSTLVFEVELLGIK